MEVYRFSKYLKEEIYRNENIKKNWYKIFSNVRYFLFFFRISYVLVRKKNKLLRIIGILLNKKINRKNGTDIDYRAEIDIGFFPLHLPGIVIRPNIEIGKNFKIHQNCTLGLKTLDDKKMIIEDNVTLGANVVIIDGVRIGKNSYIGALTFINKDIPQNSVVYNKKELLIRRE